MSKYFAESELIINEDGSCFHLHLRPEQVADKVILAGIEVDESVETDALL